MLFGMKKGWLVGGWGVRMCIVYLVSVDLGCMDVDVLFGMDMGYI